MKKIMFLLFGVLLLSSCGNNGSGSSSDTNSNKESHYMYRLLIEDTGFDGFQRISYRGLLIGILNEDGGRYEYVPFDDEMNYDAYAAEFLIAYYAAINCYRFIDEKDSEISFEDIERALQYVKIDNLPITNEIPNEKLKEAINEAYYDYRNTTIYEPKEGYGYRDYPYDGKYGVSYLKVKRYKKEDYGMKDCVTIDGDTPPEGALLIRN
jgi:hypothetical protein